MAKSETIGEFAAKLYKYLPRHRPKREPDWREAEQYFRQHRDPKIKITLPRLRFLEEPRRG